MESLSVVIPVYNEQDNIIPLVSAIIEALGETVEVVVVDDKSTDNTQSVCKNLAQKKFPIFLF